VLEVIEQTSSKAVIKTNNRR